MLNEPPGVEPHAFASDVRKIEFHQEIFERVVTGQDLFE